MTPRGRLNLLGCWEACCNCSFYNQRSASNFALNLLRENFLRPPVFALPFSNSGIRHLMQRKRNVHNDAIVRSDSIVPPIALTATSIVVASVSARRLAAIRSNRTLPVSNRLVLPVLWPKTWKFRVIGRFVQRYVQHWPARTSRDDRDQPRPSFAPKRRNTRCTAVLCQGA